MIMERMMLEVPEEVVEAIKLPPREVEQELLRELAVALYRRGVLSLGKARVLAQMTRWEFEEYLGHRGVSRHYGQADLAEDLQYAAGHQ
jgi:predicted HTH domain antitoxin